MKYWRYFVYILKHKWRVTRECWKERLYWQGIVHDLSKFSPAEFFSYADKFFSGKKMKNIKYYVAPKGLQLSACLKI